MIDDAKMALIQQIRSEVLRMVREIDLLDSGWVMGKRSACNRILNFLDTIQEQPVCEELEMASERYATMHPACFKKVISEAFKAGAEWRNVKDGEF